MSSFHNMGSNHAFERTAASAVRLLAVPALLRSVAAVQREPWAPHWRATLTTPPLLGSTDRSARPHRTQPAIVTFFSPVSHGCCPSLDGCGARLKRPKARFTEARRVFLLAFSLRPPYR